MDIELAVETYHEGLFAFALSLAGNRDDACELTQETFCRFAGKGHQLRDQAKIKAWLFTTLYRVFLGWKRRESRLPHFEMSTVEHELPHLAPEVVEAILDGRQPRDLTLQSLRGQLPDEWSSQTDWLRERSQ